MTINLGLSDLLLSVLWNSGSRVLDTKTRSFDHLYQIGAAYCTWKITDTGNPIIRVGTHGEHTWLSSDCLFDRLCRNCRINTYNWQFERHLGNAIANLLYPLNNLVQTHPFGIKADRGPLSSKIDVGFLDAFRFLEGTLDRPRTVRARNPRNRQI